MHKKALRKVTSMIKNKPNGRYLKKAYKTSIRSIKAHPYESAGILALGLGVISSLIYFYKLRQ